MNNEKTLLLSDEKDISINNYKERFKLYREFLKMPTEFFSKLRHFQPQIGCLNACSICSKYANTRVSYWNEDRIRNVVAALKYATPKQDKPYIVWDRNSHRNGVIFSYLDNDVGNYYYLDKFINIANKELGVKTRISTVGFSRYNEELNKMHFKISNMPDKLAGVRLSLTPYTIGYKNCKSNDFDRYNYLKDVSNFLKIYKNYFDVVGSGARNFCVELRYKPLVENEDVYAFNFEERFVIYSYPYLYISKNKNIEFLNTQIKDAKIHRLSLNNDGEDFYKIKIGNKLNTKEEIQNYLKLNKNNIEKEVKIFRVENRDGYYYSVDPILTDNGNYGINIYPITSTRKKSGYVILERFLLNELFNYKKSKFLKIEDEFKNATWQDVDNVINLLHSRAIEYKENNEHLKYQYIINELLPMLNLYISALKFAGYDAYVFFDKNFTIDTGIICNLGRAINEFKGLVSVENEPLTLNHERNYGKNNSTMVIEESAWRLSCDYDDKIILEELNLSNTATKDGQVCYNNIINLDKKDEKIEFKNLKKEYLIPGQRKIR